MWLVLFAQPKDAVILVAAEHADAACNFAGNILQAKLQAKTSEIEIEDVRRAYIKDVDPRKANVAELAAEMHPEQAEEIFSTLGKEAQS